MKCALTLIHSGRFTPQPRQSMLRRIQVLHELSTRISSHFCRTNAGANAEVSEGVDLDNHQSGSVPFCGGDMSCEDAEKRGLISVCWLWR